MALSVASYKQRMGSLELEVENKSTRFVLQKRARNGLEHVEVILQSPFSFPLLGCSRPLREPKKTRVELAGIEWRRMDTPLLLEEKHILLKNELGERLRNKHALELEITKRFEELKRLEISLEKRACLMTMEE